MNHTREKKIMTICIYIFLSCVAIFSSCHTLDKNTREMEVVREK